MANIINMFPGGGGGGGIESFQNTPWSTISAVGAAGNAPSHWAIGDRRYVIIPSALGSTLICLEIIGFGYDDLAAGGKAPITLMMVDCFANTLTMNASNTNVGGWGGCAARTTLINSLLPSLKSAIGADIIKPVIKRTSAGGISTAIVTTTDEIWLPSEFEMTGTLRQSAAGEKPTDKAAGYPRFSSNALRIKKRGADNTIYLERSPQASANNIFCVIDATGAMNEVYASTPAGVAVGFCV